MESKSEIIHRIVDQVSDEMAKLDFSMKFPEQTFNKEEHQVRSPKDDWILWRMEPSTVTEKEITRLEQLTNVQFPESYIIFLKYKHFSEFQGPELDKVSLISHHKDDWLKNIETFYNYDFAKEDLIPKKIIPIGRYYDHCILCFDANEKKGENEYTIIGVDLDRINEPETYTLFSPNFIQLLLDNFTFDR